MEIVNIKRRASDFVFFTISHNLFIIIPHFLFKMESVIIGKSCYDEIEKRSEHDG